MQQKEKILEMPPLKSTIFLSGTAQLVEAFNRLEASKLEQLFRCPSTRNM
jgi:hypothetical protein